MQVLGSDAKSVAKLLEPSLKDTGDQLRASDKEDIPLVLGMRVEIEVAGQEPLPVEPQQVLPLPELDEVEDEGVLPNQQAIAQELLGRVLLMTGAFSSVALLGSFGMWYHLSEASV